MVKQKRLLARSGIVLTFILSFVVLWGVFFRETFLPLAMREILGIIFSVQFLRQMTRSLTKTEVRKQWHRAEVLRMISQEAPLCKIQPETDQTKLLLPVALTMCLAYAVYFGCAVFWFASFGITLLLWNILGETESVGSLLFAWFALGGIIIGLTGILMYQRVEITEQALIVQRGLKRRKILWEEARLFASVRSLEGEDVPIQYELSNANVVLRWPASPPGFGFVSHPKERAEYEHLLNDLLTYIRTRTGLPLLDLSQNSAS